MNAWVGPQEDPRRYRFAGGGEPVGGGGEGFVYRAWRCSDGLSVAVKQLVSVTPADWTPQVARIAILGTLSHPRLGRHLDAFVGPYPFADAVPPADEFEICYTVMAWVEGEDLSDAVQGADLPVAFGWVRDVAHAAAALHRHPTPTGMGIVHRDIKPSNIRVSGFDSDARTGAGAVLIDFGIARPLAGPTMTRQAGAPGWMPPEAFEDHRSVGARSDTWQVGGLAAWVLLGSPPGALVGDDRRARLETALRQRRIAGARALARHIDQALAPRPADRPADVARWGDRLVTLASAPAGRARQRLAAAAAAGALAILVLATVLWMRSSTGEPQGEGAGASGTPTIGAVALDTEITSPFDFGEPIVLTIGYRPDGDRPAVLRVEPRSGGQPAAGTTALTAPVERPTQRVSFAVADPGHSTPVRIDELLLRALDSTGATLAEQSVPVDLTAAPPIEGPEQCFPYDPGNVVVAPGPAPLLRILGSRTDRSPSDPPVEFGVVASAIAAEHAVSVARQADTRCVLGGRDGDLPVSYWRRNGRLLGQLPPSAARSADEGCSPYRPESLNVIGSKLYAGTELLASFTDPGDLARALNLARHYRVLCVVGRDGPGSRDDARRATFTYWQ